MSEKEALLVFCDAMDSAVTQLRQNLGAPTKKDGKTGFTYDAEKIHWEPATGTKGPYQLATVQANADNIDFGLLSKALEENQKPIWSKQYFYWKLENGGIGRKPIAEVKRKGKQ